MPPPVAYQPVCTPGLVPPLASQDSKPADVTLYLTIDLGVAGQQPKTCVYVPDRKQLSTDVNVILYLHGHKWAIKKGMDIEEQLTLPRSGTKLWYPLREEIAQASKKNFVFVAPTLGDYSEGGDLIDKASGAGYPFCFLQQVMRGLQKHLSLKSLPHLNNLILAAHSGGGVAMRHLASHPAIVSYVKEVWCFDCLYSGTTDVDSWDSWSAVTAFFDYWTSWAGKTQHRLFVHSTGKHQVKIDEKKPWTADNLKWADGTYSESKSLKAKTAGRANVQVEMMTRTVDHNDSPSAWIKDLIDRSGALS